jgi:two-component system chemotaxis response regulator CheY
VARVLIADDSAIVRLVLRDMLEKAGHEVIAEAENGEEAIVRFAESRPDVSVIDVNMPVLDGFAAADSLRQVRPNARLVLASVYVTPSRAARARAIGARLLAKPFTTEELLGEIVAN